MTRQAASTHPRPSPAAEAGKDVDRLCIDTIRTLAIDAVQKANSGHAGAPMGFAPVAYTLWQNVLRYDPADPLWPNRDRFVLSNGHACMLLYALLHLAGVRRLDGGRVTAAPAISLDDIKSFRQIDSVTPGHPEYGRTTGVECTTGPLGQGCGNSVGMAIASRWLGARYNRDNFKIFDFDVYTICSDGDLMEGVASEAASLAGHLRLANLCWIYDNNTVTIEGHTRSPSAKTSKPASRAIAGTCCGCATPMTPRRCRGRSTRSSKPTIARPSSSSTASSVTARRISRTPRPRIAIRSARRKCG